MVQDFNGRTVVITAAGQGIGRATAERFISLGARVIATDINEQALSTLKGAETRVLNVLDGDGVRISPPISAMPMCCSTAPVSFIPAPFSIAKKRLGFLFRSQRQGHVPHLPRLPARYAGKGKGAIVNMSSVASSVKGVPNRFAYTASKAAVVGLTKAIAADFVTKGIRCNAICPGTVDSPSLHDRLRATGNYEQALADFIARQPMGRIATPEEIAALRDVSRF